MNEVFKETEIMVEEVNTYIFSGQLKYSYLELSVCIIYMCACAALIEEKKVRNFLCSNEVMLRVGYYKRKFTGKIDLVGYLK